MKLDGFIAVLAYAALPALGNLAGALLAELRPVPERVLGLALHAAAGVLFAVIGIELMGRAVAIQPAWVPILGFIGGGAFAVLVDRSIDLVHKRFSSEAGATTSWGIYLGVTVDLFSDGLMIGTGTAVATTLGLLLALGQVPADFPEGFVSAATFRRLGLPRRRRLVLAMVFLLPVWLGATVGYWAMRDQSPVAQLTLLAFTAGILLTIAVEEMLVEAHTLAKDNRPGEDPLEAVALIGGFALFALISAYLA